MPLSADSSGWAVTASSEARRRARQGAELQVAVRAPEAAHEVDHHRPAVEQAGQRDHAADRDVGQVEVRRHLAHPQRRLGEAAVAQPRQLLLDRAARVGAAARRERRRDQLQLRREGHQFFASVISRAPPVKRK
jgi:hypothetical protein